MMILGCPQSVEELLDNQNCLGQELTSGMRLSMLSKSDFEESKRTTRLLYICCNASLKAYSALLPADALRGFALLGPRNEILRLYGPPAFLSLAKSHQLEPKCQLNQEDVGTSAISIAQKYHKPCLTQSEEHSSEPLKGLFFAFAPCYYTPSDSEKGEVYLGGIAAFGVPGDYEPDCLIMVSGQAINACYTISRSTGYLHYVDGVTGKIVLNYDFGHPLIVYCSPHTRSILKIPSRGDILFTPISQTFDPPPKNSDFWDIYNSRRNVTNYPISISIQGTTKRYIISTLHEKQEILGHETLSILFKSGSDDEQKAEIKHETARAQYTFHDIHGRSKDLLFSIDCAMRFAQIDMNLLITGERGTGKDIFAQAVHNASTRREGPFIAINCASIPKDLISSELFGYEHGAFSGGRKEGYCGKIALAEGGTLFLDEIGDMPLEIQAVLLRAVEDKQYMRLGGTKQIRPNVRFIFATNADLGQMVQKGTFRGDLYDRIRALRLDIPPLRRRKDDIPELANHFLTSACKKVDLPEKQLSHEAIEILKTYSWPGNVRELKNAVEAVTFTYPAMTIPAETLKAYLNFTQYSEPISSSIFQSTPSISAEKAALPERTKDLTKDLILDTLKDLHYNKTAVAKKLQISRKTLYQRMREFEIEI